MRKYVSIDIGGTAIKYGIIDENGEILMRSQMPTEAYRGGLSIVKKAVDIVERCQTGSRLSGICISTAGMVDVEKGEIFYAAPLIPDYAGTQWKQIMEKTFGISCEVENDVNCAGLAESVSGAARGSRSSVCLTIGTGIGGCILIDGKLYRGYSGSACEIGYMHLDGGEFQNLGAASILSAKVAARKGESAAEWDGYRIFEAAKEKDPICVRAIDELTDVLGQGIANICYVLNPQTVVLGGGIMAQEAYLKPRIEAALHRHLIGSIASHTTIKMAEHKNDAGMLGAFYHFLLRQNRPR